MPIQASNSRVGAVRIDACGDTPTGYHHEGIGHVSLNQEEDPKLQLRSSSQRLFQVDDRNSNP
ncbi:hypothetical protein [Thermoplasma acidophilum]|uniref:hypothetical protein n=1 Tax=Thermoplasma acidophilum TaxID=2303 RepID=UPI0012EA52D5|nr:hypothetical protein [Thermoplasma acidophilum]